MAELLHGDQVARKDFSLAFRGFDQHEVRAFLGQVAAELVHSQERAEALEARIAELEAAGDGELDEAALEQALGHEATKVIHAAREAAAEIRARAEGAASTLLREANDQASRAREEADAILARARAEADETASAMRAELDLALTALRDDTERRATSILDESRAKAEALVAEASSERDRVLDDLAERRRALVSELESLHESRERLVGAYRELRRALDEAVGRVVDADRQAEQVMQSTTTERAADPPVEPAPDVVGADPEPDQRETEPEIEPEVEPEVEAPAEAAANEPEPEPSTPEHVVLSIVESTSTPEPLPEPPRPDERRSSSLRLLRRRDPEPEPPEAIVGSDDFESVRIIRPVAPDETVDDAEPAEPEPVAAADVDVGADDVPAVDDLFARLRADRAEKVARAESVLSAGEEIAVEAPSAPPSADADGAAPSPDASLLAARDDAVAETERGLVRSLKRALADEQNEVLDGLRRLRGTPSVDALLPDIAVHDARFEAVLDGPVTAAAGAGAAVVGGDGHIAAPVAAELGRAVAADLRSRVGRAVDDAGGDVETLAEAISAAYREWKTARVEPLARDAMTASFAAGLYSASAGTLRWVVDPAEGGCPDCDDNALAGPTAKGTAFPTGQLHPPAHAGCRCAVVPGDG